MINTSNIEFISNSLKQLELEEEQVVKIEYTSFTAYLDDDLEAILNTDLYDFTDQLVRESWRSLLRLRKRFIYDKL